MLFVAPVERVTYRAIHPSSPIHPLCRATLPRLGRLPDTLLPVNMHLHYWMSVQSCFLDLLAWTLTSLIRFRARAEYGVQRKVGQVHKTRTRV
jgi:hypothetical protein